MRSLALFFILISALCAVTIEDIRNWDELGQYNRICTDEARTIFIEKQDVSLANIYAKACLKMDRLNELIIPMVMLYKDKYSRENAALYSTILFQKKLLYLALIDGVDISYIKTPKINYILSEIFDKFVSNDYTKISDKFIFIGENGQKYELFIKDDEDIKKMVLVLYKEDKIDSIKTYW